MKTIGRGFYVCQRFFGNGKCKGSSSIKIPICMFLRHSKCYGSPNKGGVCALKCSYWKEKLFSLPFRVQSVKELWQSSSALSEELRRLSNSSILENSKLKYHRNSWFVLSSPGVKGKRRWERGWVPPCLALVPSPGSGAIPCGTQGTDVFKFLSPVLKPCVGPSCHLHTSLASCRLS